MADLEAGKRTLLALARSRVLAEIKTSIDTEATRQITVIRGYTETVFDGNDPVVAARGSWGDPAKTHFKQVNDAYRAEMGLPVIPYHPGTIAAYRMCEALLAEPGAWLPAAHLARIGSSYGKVQVMATLKDHDLAKGGWKLEKKTNPVQYRLVPIEGSDD